MIILSRDTYYYTGTSQPSILVVTPDDFCLMVRRAHDFVEQETFLPHDKILNRGDFAEHLGLAPSIVSHHFKELRLAGLLNIKREGKTVFVGVNAKALEAVKKLF